MIKDNKNKLICNVADADKITISHHGGCKTKQSNSRHTTPPICYFKVSTCLRNNPNLPKLKFENK